MPSIPATISNVFSRANSTIAALRVLDDNVSQCDYDADNRETFRVCIVLLKFLEQRYGIQKIVWVTDSLVISLKTKGCAEYLQHSKVTFDTIHSKVRAHDKDVFIIFGEQQ